RTRERRRRRRRGAPDAITADRRGLRTRPGGGLGGPGCAGSFSGGAVGDERAHRARDSRGGGTRAVAPACLPVRQRSPAVAAGGAIGDAVFTSFRKYLPVPDGGLLTGAKPASLPPAAASLRERLLGQLLRGAWASGQAEGPEVEAVFLGLLEAGEASLDEELPLEATSRLSERLLARLDLADAASRRRANFVALLEALDGSDAVTPLLRTLPPGVPPLA